MLYGTGVTIGAGIYVLIGAIANRAGTHAPLAFVFNAIVMGLTVRSYAELCTRFPVVAGEAAYVRAAFHGRWLPHTLNPYFRPRVAGMDATKPTPILLD